MYDKKKLGELPEESLMEFLNESKKEEFLEESQKIPLYK